jgi:hypothetical protein
MRTATFQPKNEINVRELFAQRAARLGYRILESRSAFPDYVLERDGQKLFAEAEYRTSDFLRHRHDLGRCDLILVWEHDVSYMPIPILDLRAGVLLQPRRRRAPAAPRWDGRRETTSSRSRRYARPRRTGRP